MRILANRRDFKDRYEPSGSIDNARFLQLFEAVRRPAKLLPHVFHQRFAKVVRQFIERQIQLNRPRQLILALFFTAFVELLDFFPQIASHPERYSGVRTLEK